MSTSAPSSKHALSVPGVRPQGSMLRVIWSNSRHAIREELRRRHDLRRLEAMDDHELRDIGVSRDQLETAIWHGRRHLPPAA